MKLNNWTLFKRSPLKPSHGFFSKYFMYITAKSSGNFDIFFKSRIRSKSKAEIKYILYLLNEKTVLLGTGSCKMLFEKQ